MENELPKQNKEELKSLLLPFISNGYFMTTYKVPDTVRVDTLTATALGEKDFKTISVQ